jgi:hypothetical protein
VLTRRWWILAIQRFGSIALHLLLQAIEGPQSFILFRSEHFVTGWRRDDECFRQIRMAIKEAVGEIRNKLGLVAVVADDLLGKPVDLLFAYDSATRLFLGYPFQDLALLF